MHIHTWSFFYKTTVVHGLEIWTWNNYTPMSFYHLKNHEIKHVNYVLHVTYKYSQTLNKLVFSNGYKTSDLSVVNYGLPGIKLNGRPIAHNFTWATSHHFPDCSDFPTIILCQNFGPIPNEKYAPIFPNVNSKIP